MNQTNYTSLGSQVLHEAHEQGTQFALIDLLLLVNMLSCTLHHTSRTLSYFRISLHEYLIQTARGLNDWIDKKTGLDKPAEGYKDYSGIEGLALDICKGMEVVAHMSHLCFVVASIALGFGIDVDRGTVRMCILCSCMAIMVYAMVEASVLRRLNLPEEIRLEGSRIERSMLLPALRLDEHPTRSKDDTSSTTISKSQDETKDKTEAQWIPVEAEFGTAWGERPRGSQ